MTPIINATKTHTLDENEGESRELANNSSNDNNNCDETSVEAPLILSSPAETSTPLLNPMSPSLLPVGSNSSSPLLSPVVSPPPISISKLAGKKHIPAEIDTSSTSLCHSSSTKSNEDSYSNLGPRKSLSLPYPRNNPKERSNSLSYVKESMSLNRSKSLREGIHSRDSCHNGTNHLTIRKTGSESGVHQCSSSLHHSYACYTPGHSPTKVITPEIPIRPLSSTSSPASLERRLSILTQSYSDLSLSITDDNFSDWDDFLYGYARGKFDPLSIPRKPRRSSSKRSYTSSVGCRDRKDRDRGDHNNSSTNTINDNKLSLPTSPLSGITTFGDDWDVEYIEAWRRDGARGTGSNTPGTPSNGLDAATNYAFSSDVVNNVNSTHQHELHLTAIEDSIPSNVRSSSASLSLETHTEISDEENNYEGYDEYHDEVYDHNEDSDDEFEPEYLPPPLPPNEGERRRALWRFQILNTSQDVNFSRIARLVKQHFKVPISLISLVNTTHQWFKAEEGLGCSSTTREVSFCGHAILQETAEPFVVPDALVDWRFKKNPLVTGPPYIRFYAGAPLRTKDGHNLGTICLIDNNRRDNFSADDRKVLKDYAKVVVRELELWADRLRLRVRNKMQDSIAEFSKFCLESMKSQLLNKETGEISRKRESVWSKNPEKESCEIGDRVMQKCFEMAVKLMRDTLEVDALYLLEMPSLSSKSISSTGRTSDFSSFFLNSPPPEPGIKHLRFLASVGIELSTDYLSTPTTTSFLTHLMETHEQGYIFQNALPPLPALFPPQMQSGIVVPIYDNSQNAFGFLIALTTDASRQFEDEERVYIGNFGVNVVSEVLKRRVIVADRAKGVFISSMSHELRTPLHGILASCELLEDSKMTDAQKELLKTIQGCGTSLISILNSVLDFAKLERRHHHTSSLSTIASSDESTTSSSNIKSADDGVNSVGTQNHDNNSKTTSSDNGIRSRNKSYHRILQKVDLVAIIEEVSESCSIGQQMLSAVYGASSNTVNTSKSLKSFDSLVSSDSLNEILENHTDSTTTHLRKRICDLLHPYQYTSNNVDDKNDHAEEQQTVELMLDIEPKSEGWCVMADDGSVRQILMNIIGNSLKFTKKGYVHISLTTVPTSTNNFNTSSDPKRISVLFTITDTGKGISPDFLTTHLFQPFSQEDSLQAGTGLGLSIVKLLVEKMDGRLDVESALGTGTRVRIWLDFDLPPSDNDDDSNNDNDDNKSKISDEEKERILQEFAKMQLCIYGVHGKLREVVEKYFRTWHGMKRIAFEEQADRMRGDLLVINDDLDALRTVWFLDHHKQQQLENRRSSLSNLVSPLLNIAASATVTKDVHQQQNKEWDHSPIILVTSIAKYAKAADFVESLQHQVNFISEINSPNQFLCAEDTQQGNSPQLTPNHSHGIQISAKSLPKVVVMTPNHPPHDHHLNTNHISSSNNDFSLSSSSSSSSSSSYEHSDENSDENLIFMPSPLITSPNETNPFFRNILDNTDNLTTTEPVSDFRVESSSSSPNQLSQQLLLQMQPYHAQLASSFNSEKLTNAAFTASFDRSYSLPATPVPEIHQQSLMIAPTIVGPKGPRVLVVEDNAVNRMILVTYLKKRGIGYEEAENGAIGVNKFRRCLEYDEEQEKLEFDKRTGERRRFDVVLMDIQMPVMDGNKATAEIRKLEKEYAEKHQSHSSGDGNTDVFRKNQPNSLSTSPLVSLLSPLLNTAANRDLASSDISTNDLNLETSTSSLHDPQSAKTVNFETKSQPLFTSSQNRALIFALTGLASEEDKDLAFESGVDGFLTKPISLKVLDRVLKRWFERCDETATNNSIDLNNTDTNTCSINKVASSDPVKQNKSSNLNSNPLSQKEPVSLSPSSSAASPQEKLVSQQKAVKTATSDNAPTSDSGLCNMVG
ncbi:1095_t:CDS:10 [Ambispora leptoticha]|uniref:histidine kinase n=1 Tax=Ambispora leptoticha TaxID=144679 RepID=A0A9N9F6I1_9GLOM|nr:1095_t:CDS:10 [Ambispora leptoticha]